jgi:hypothetical protein
MKKEIIIARHNEDISWTEPYKEYLRIYDKGTKALEYESIHLPNIGRESHTYLYHIVENYDNLADYTVFSQATPWDHSHDFAEKLSKILDDDYSDRFMWLSAVMHMSDLDGINDPHRPTLPNYREAYNLIFNEDRQEPFMFGAGAIFCVSKEIIQLKPKSFYEKALSLFLQKTGQDVCEKFLIDDNRNFNPEKPVVAYHFERFWGLIFDV